MDWDDDFFEEDEPFENVMAAWNKAKAEGRIFVTAPPSYDCRHGCNGDCVVFGYDNGQCGITCHPGLHYDEEAARRREDRLEELERCCYDGIDCTTSPTPQPQTRPPQPAPASRSRCTDG